MNLKEIARLRLRNQRLAGGRLRSAVDVVGWLGAVQAQEYPYAKWSVAMRAIGLTDSDLDQALADGSILRTHILRPTWHFVLPADIRSMMALTGPRVMARMAPVARQTDLDPATASRALDVIADSLAGGRLLTRAELGGALAEHGFAMSGFELSLVVMQAELELITVSGGLRGKQHTYALGSDRIPSLAAGGSIDRGQALAELTRRYFTSHGPATIADFTAWSTLTVADTRRGLEINGAALSSFELDRSTYWWAEDTADGPDDPSPTIHLLQGYDEYIMGYRAPRSFLNVDGLIAAPVLGAPPWLHAVVLDTQVAGWWRRVSTKAGFEIETRLVRAPSAAESSALNAAVTRYSGFVGRQVAVR